MFLLTNKVWSPQFSLWLVPLAVLALPHRRILLAWMTIDALVWVPRMFYSRRAEQGLPEQWFTVTVLLRDIAVIGAVRVGDSADLSSRAGPGAHRGEVDDPSAECSTGRRMTRPRLPDWLARIGQARLSDLTEPEHEIAYHRFYYFARRERLRLSLNYA